MIFKTSDGRTFQALSQMKSHQADLNLLSAVWDAMRPGTGRTAGERSGLVASAVERWRVAKERAISDPDEIAK